MSRVFTKVGKMIQDVFEEQPVLPKAKPDMPGESVEEMAEASVTSAELPNVDDTPLDPRTGAEPLEFTIPESTANAQDLADYDVMPESLQGRLPPRRNINLDFFEDEQTKKTIDFYNRDQGVASQDELPARRVVSHEETLSKSVKSDHLSDAERRERITKVIGGSINDKWQPEDLVSIYQMLDVQGRELHAKAIELNKMIDEGLDPGEDVYANYQLLEERFNATMEIASTRAAEAGRMLNALQALGKEGTREYARTVQEVVRGSGGKKSIEEKIRIMAGTDPEDPKALGDAARNGWWTRFKDGLTRLRYNMMLSSVRTHFANISGSTMTGFWEAVPLNVANIGISNADHVVRHMLQKTFMPNIEIDPMARAQLSEVYTLPMDMIMATREAFKAGSDVFTGKRAGHGKIYNEMGIRMSQSTLGGPAGKAWQTAKNVGNIPTRLLEAEDTFFRTVFYNAKVKQLARRAAALADSGEADKVFNDLVEYPTESMKNDGMDFAGKLTFTNDPSAYGELLSGIARAGSNMQNTTAGRLILPFVRTPTNIVGYTLENTALGGAVAPKQFLSELMSPDPNVATDARSRLMVAAGLWMYLKDHWENGRITGDNPGNYGLQRAREGMGWKANSIRIGDEYHELNRADPMGLMLAVMATAYDVGSQSTAEDAATAAAAGIVTTATMIADRSMLAGIGDLERVFASSEQSVGKQAGKFLARLGSSFVVPSFMRDFREMKDPVSRAMDVPDTIVAGTYEAFRKTAMNAAPWWSEDLPPQVDALGDDRIRGEGFIWRGTIPIRAHQIEQDPVVAAWIATGQSLNKPDSQFTLPGTIPVDILKMDNYEGWAFREYQKILGYKRYDLTKQFLNSKIWKDALKSQNTDPNSIAADALDTILTKADLAAKVEFMDWVRGKTEFEPRVQGKGIGRKIQIDSITKQELIDYTILAKKYAADDEEVRKLLKEREILIYKERPDVFGMPEEAEVQYDEAPRF